MKNWYVVIFGLFALILSSCGKGDDDFNPFNPGTPPPTPPNVTRPASIGITGDTADVSTTTHAGLVIMGGGADVDEAFRWMIDRSGGGDVVIIRASGTDAYNPYVNQLGKVNSVETLKIDTRRLAQDDGVVRIIRNAEMLFIAGGDQSDYTENWKNTKVMDAINYLLTVKKIPVGGTSAGAAILGNYYFSGERGSVTSTTALNNPYNSDITLYNDDFLTAPFLDNIITDQHFSQRERQGRTMVFLARIIQDWDKTPNAIAVDEATAVCIDENGMAEVVGDNHAFFMRASADKKPAVIAANQPLTWNYSGEAVAVTSINGQSDGNQFDLVNFQVVSDTGVSLEWWSVENGNIYIKDN